MSCSPGAGPVTVFRAAHHRENWRVSDATSNSGVDGASPPCSEALLELSSALPIVAQLSPTRTDLLKADYEVMAKVWYDDIAPFLN